MIRILAAQSRETRAIEIDRGNDGTADAPAARTVPGQCPAIVGNPIVGAPISRSHLQRGIERLNCLFIASLLEESLAQPQIGRG